MAKGKRVDLVALRGFVGEDAGDDGRKVRHARGEKVSVSKPVADALLHSAKAARPDSDAAKTAVKDLKDAEKDAKK